MVDFFLYFIPLRSILTEFHFWLEIYLPYILNLHETLYREIFGVAV